ncbi:MAG: hypothetical protein HN757_18650, partial [Calditrichaeota bacterium]|nr:hypothetical protein [Calditrichota bacterium]
MIKKYFSFLPLLYGLIFLFYTQNLQSQCSVDIGATPGTPTTSRTIDFVADALATSTAYTFNGGLLPNEWESSPYEIGSPCDPLYGDSPDASFYFWATTTDANGVRFVQTVPINVLSGGEISFNMRYGRDDPNPGCEDPDNSSEDIATSSDLSSKDASLYSFFRKPLTTLCLI